MDKLINFKPIVHENWNKILKYEKLEELLCAYGCPLNIINLDSIKENTDKFKNIYSESMLKGKIFFAQKCSKSESVLRKILKEGICLDVSSEKELVKGLEKGFTGDKIVATGPKNDRFIELCVRHKVLISIDNENELEKVIELSRNLNLRTNILLRITNFTYASRNIKQKDSKFGIPFKKVHNIIEKIAQYEEIVFKGVHIHLDTVNVDEKMNALENILKLIEFAYSKGMNPDTIDIGGGYSTETIEDKEAYYKSLVNIEKSVKGDIPQITYNGFPYGIILDESRIKKGLSLADIHLKDAKTYIYQILNSKLPEFQNNSALDVILDGGINLNIEPGRAIMSHAGITISKVNFVKELDSGDKMAILDMKGADITFSNQEIFLDPLHIYEEERKDLEEGIYLAGNLCMESDLIFRRKVYFDKEVKKGDIIVFMNTGGYYMDFNRTDTARQKIARTICMEKDKIFLDEEYF